MIWALFFTTQEDSEELEEAKQVGYKENDFGSTVRDPSEKNIDPVESRIEGSRNNFLEKKGLHPSMNFLICLVNIMALKCPISWLLAIFKNYNQLSEFDHDETKDQEAQWKGLYSSGGDQVRTI